MVMMSARVAYYHEAEGKEDSSAIRMPTGGVTWKASAGFHDFANVFDDSVSFVI